MRSLGSLAVSLAIGLGAAGAIPLWGGFANAAEKVVLRYGILRESVTVGELTTFAQSGQMNPALIRYIRKANSKPEDVQTTLTREIKVDAKLLDKALNHPLGETILDQLGDVIHTPSKTADRQALRSALILSASKDNRVSILEILQNYPTQEVQVDGDRLAATYRQLNEFAQRLQQWGRWIPKF